MQIQVHNVEKKKTNISFIIKLGEHCRSFRMILF